MGNRIAGWLSCLFLMFPVSGYAVEIGVHVVIDSNMVTEHFNENELTDRVERIFDYLDNNVDIQLLPVRYDLRSLDFNTGSELLSDMENEQGIFNNILSEADWYGADYIIAVAEVGHLELCGLANLNNTQSRINNMGLSVGLFDPDCGETTLVHELGHLMGLAHGDQVAVASNDNSEDNGLKSYAQGWGYIDDLVTNDGDGNDEALESGEYGTIMVGNHVHKWTRSTSDIVLPPVLSNPDVYLDACNNSQCGHSTNGNAVRVLNEHKNIYAAHENADVNYISYSDDKLTSCMSGYSNTEIDQLTILNCSSKGIHTLDGIDRLTSLSIIYLSSNRIIDLSPLEKLSNNPIQTIRLYGNKTAPCHQIDRLKSMFPGKITAPSSCLNVGALVSALSFI